MNRKNQVKSIKKSSRYIFSIIFSVMIIMFLTSFFMKKVIVSEYDKSMQTSMMISRLSYDVNNYAVLFDRYIRGRDNETYEEYIEARGEIELALAQLDEELYDNQSLIFMRNLNNMYDYQSKLANRIIADRSLNEATYSKITEIKTLFSYMNRHFQLLSVAYLDYSSKRYSKLLEDYKKTENNLYTFFVVFSLLVFGIAIKRLNDILSTVDNLSESAKLLSDAHWEIPDIEKGYYQELNTLAFAFNKMKVNIKAFIEELQQKAELEKNLNQARMNNIQKDKLLKESQLQTLQAQMDPHFLFNTLNIISRVAMFENADTSVKLIESISKILRFNLEHMGKTVTLGEEMSVLKAYAVIQETRFQSRISFKFEFEEEILNVIIPPMLIQPLVENSVIHGFQNEERQGEICVKVIRDGEFLKIEVSDNGKGISENELSVIFNELRKKSKDESSTRIGLNNIRKMLAFYFDREDLLHLESELDKGTKVTIVIPMEEQSGGVENV